VQDQTCWKNIENSSRIEGQESVREEERVCVRVEFNSNFLLMFRPLTISYNGLGHCEKELLGGRCSRADRDARQRKELATLHTLATGHVRSNIEPGLLTVQTPKC
jgi:hypothetical protein